MSNDTEIAQRPAVGEGCKHLRTTSFRIEGEAVLAGVANLSSHLAAGPAFRMGDQMKHWDTLEVNLQLIFHCSCAKSRPQWVRVRQRRSAERLGCGSRMIPCAETP